MMKTLKAPSHEGTTWVVVANGKGAQVYRYHTFENVIPLGGIHKHPVYEERISHELVPVQDGVIKAETIDDYQIGHSRRGTSVSSIGATRNTYEPSGDIQGELKRRFTHNIAEHLAKAYAAKSFSRLVLVAPAKILGAIKEQLTPEVQGCIAAVLPKDLAAYDARTLLMHLQDTLTNLE